MAVVTSRATFEKLSALRLKEAKLLLADGDWDGAYYLAGYAVESALKVKIISDLMKSDSFPEKKFASDFYTHELKVLLGLANLGEIKNDPVVRSHWDVVSGWSEQARYVIGKSEQDARDLYNAIESQVLPWSKARY